jgi:osmoprotectant transport system substrate-binding protein
MRRIISIFTILLLGGVLLLGLTAPASACVGKSLTIGSKGGAQQDVLAQMLAILISERTGTTVKVAHFDSTAAVHRALLKADLDMYVEYTGIGQVEILGRPAVADAEALFQAVKTSYNEDLNLIWLTPLGFEEPSAISGVAAQAAPVVRKDTLKKFPALARLINRLGGSIDEEKMRELEVQVAKRPAAEVAREFLKAGKLI